MVFNGCDLLIMSKIERKKKSSLRGFVLHFLIKHVLVAITIIMFWLATPGSRENKHVATRGRVDLID